MQITLFDYDTQLQASDNVLHQLQNMLVDTDIRIDELYIYRTPRLYVVCKGDEFEEPFHDVETAYQFVNHVMEW